MTKSAGSRTTTTIENYIKAIYLEQQANSDVENGSDLVSMGRLAEILGVVPGTATAMVKRLTRERLIIYKPYAGVKLTAKGRRIAIHVIRKHRLVEALLVEVLGLDWTEVHEDAEQLEHVISDKLLERIDAMLGYPAVDPHGDPIPRDLLHEHDKLDSGEQAKSAWVRITECSVKSKYRIVRVMEQKEEYLRFFDKHGLKPGAVVEVIASDLVADSISLKSEKHAAVTLGRSAAFRLLVEVAGIS